MADERFAADVWRPSLETYGRVTHLTIAVYDAHGGIACGPFNPTPLFDALAASEQNSGLVTECIQRCLGTDKQQPSVVVTRFGLAVIGAPLVVNGEVIAAAIGGYHLSEFRKR